MRDDFDISYRAIEYATKEPKSYKDSELLASEALEIYRNQSHTATNHH